MRYHRMLPRVEELAGPTMKRCYFLTALGNGRGSRRGGRYAIRPNVPAPKRNKLHRTSSRGHGYNTADRRLRSHERPGLTNVPIPPSLRDGVAGPRVGAFAHLLKPSAFLIINVFNCR